MPPLEVGSACECIYCEQRCDRYMAWVVKFRDLTQPEHVIELMSLPDDRPNVEVGRRYRLEVNAVEL